MQNDSWIRLEKKKAYTITFSVLETPVGLVLMAAIDGALCDVRLGNNRDELLEGVKRAWPGSTFEKGEPTVFKLKLEDFFAFRDCSMRFAVRGTDFQLKVWQALREVAPGAMLSYAELAQRIGKPQAHRAVASAVAKNPVSLFIPCHRIIYASGATGRYAWGADIKAALLAHEANAGK